MTASRIAHPEQAPRGQEKIHWAWDAMPVLRYLAQKHGPSKPLAGRRVTVCLHLEAKTACLLKTLKLLGAEVAAAGSNPLSTQDDVCAALVEEGIAVYSHRGMDPETYCRYLRDAISFDPDIIIDDGGDLVSLLHEERPDLLPRIRGGCEETTTGVKRLRAMELEGVLKFPMLAVNDAFSKYLFDNRYGTGQSVWDAVMRTTNMVVAGKTVVVVGYGWCGRGVAARAQGLGASVVVVEADPHRALEALMDGHGVASMIDAARKGDVFITVTGNIHVLRGEHFDVMKDGALLANAGHFDVEISKSDLLARSEHVESYRPNVTTYGLRDGRRLHLLAEGRLVNLAAGDGHPIEIMDMSFALQLLSVLHLCHTELPPGVHRVPDDLDRQVALSKLASLGLAVERLTPEQEAYLSSWKE